MRNDAKILYERYQITEEVIDHAFDLNLVYIQTDANAFNPSIKLFLYVKGVKGDLTYLTVEITNDQRQLIILKPQIAHEIFIEQFKAGKPINSVHLQESLDLELCNELLAGYLKKSEP